MAKQVRNADGDDQVLLRLLNSTPVRAGVKCDLLADSDYAAALARELGGQGTKADAQALAKIRGPLQASARTGVPHKDLDDALEGVTQRPLPLSVAGLRWTLDGPADLLVAARAVITWADVTARLPGRLRPCGNDECELFFLDQSKGNTARWCSMAVCGNRMKARRHHARRSATS